MRLDVWLWAARFFRTRALARQAIEGGKIRIHEGSGKPSKLVHVGDRLRIARGDEHFEVDVLVPIAQRGSASVAQACYRETQASRAARTLAAEQRRLTSAGYTRPPTKPDKRARRLIQALGDIDAF
ncbi:MAG TPA: S4 domain-containing protein [Rudaea sp.]|nr:S4 domain-containing protein [Rudaea sp.]